MAPRDYDREYWIERLQKGRWGHWKYNPKHLTLDFKKTMNGERLTDNVPLVDCTNSASVLGWILHIQDKLWCDDKDIGDFLRALDDLMRSVEDNHWMRYVGMGSVGNKISSGGKDKEFDFEKHLIEQVNPIIKKSSN